MFQWIKRSLIEKEVKKLTTQKNIAVNELTEELKQTTNEYKQAMKEADELRRIMAMRNRINNLREKTRQLEAEYNDDDEEDDYDDDEEDEENVEDKLFNGIINKFLPNAQNPVITNAVAGLPKVSKIPDATARAKLEELLGKVPDDKLEKLWGLYGHLVS